MRLLFFILFNLLILFGNGQTYTRIIPIPPTPQPCILGSTAPIVKTSDGGYILNYSYGYPNWDAAGPIFSEIVKTDSLFVPQWRKDLSGENGKKTFSYNDGTSIIYTKGNGFGVGLEKINSAGQTIWSKRYIRTYPYSLLINNATTYNSNIKLAGCLMHYNGFGNWDYFSSLILEVDTAGNFVHADSLIINGSSSQINDITTDAAGNTYILGGGFIAKIASGNTVLWCKRLYTPPPAPSFSSIRILNNGDLIIGGSIYNQMVGTGTILISRITSSGTLAWTKIMDYASIMGNIQEVSNGNIVITGALRVVYGDTLKNFSAKIDQNGNQLWAKRYHEAFSMSPPYLKTNNNWYYTTFTSAPTLFNTDSLGNTNCPNSNINLNLYNFALSSNSITCVLVPITLSNSTANTTLSSMQNYVDACSYNNPTNTQELSAFNKITLSPNPSQGIFNIKTAYKISKIEITNYLGEIIHQAKVNSDLNIIDLSNQPKGVYFITVIESNKSTTLKTIIVD